MRRQITPQAWYQMKAACCPADIVFWGWAAWSGKSFELLLEPMKWFKVDWFRWVIFRRTSVQIKGWGWLWDESVELYQHLKGNKPTEWSALWRFKTKGMKTQAELKFSHLEHEKDKFNHQWLQYAFIGFDELTHFTQKQFFYLLSRNRSTCGIKPFIRCTCNPDPESWVADFIEWYLDADWYIIKERDWVIRYFTMDKDNPVWGDSKQEVIDKCPHIFNELIEKWEDVSMYVKSFTFIEWSLDENQKLLEKDKTYKANLMAQDEITKHALLHKCWKPVQDNLALVNYESLDSVSTNYLEHNIKYNEIRQLKNVGKSQEQIIEMLNIELDQYKKFKSIDKYISVDVAWFWKDLAVIKVWEGWDIVRTRIFKKSAPEDLIRAIEFERKEFNIPKYKVVYDHDWMGWGLAWKDYISFKGGDPAIEYNWVKDNYKNLKTQCFYRVIEDIINKDLMHIHEDEIYVDWVKTDMIILPWKTEAVSILKLMKADIKAIKRAKIDMEGKKQINTKEEQKIILGGRSPDFWDTIMMRFLFELRKKKTLLID